MVLARDLAKSVYNKVLIHKAYKMNTEEKKAFWKQNWNILIIDIQLIMF